MANVFEILEEAIGIEATEATLIEIRNNLVEAGGRASEAMTKIGNMDDPVYVELNQIESIVDWVLLELGLED